MRGRGREVDRDTLAEGLAVLADANRLRILDALLYGERCNCELADSLGLSANLVSHHLRALERAGFVVARRDPDDARWIHYGVISSRLDDLIAALEDQLRARRQVRRDRSRALACRPATARAT